MNQTRIDCLLLLFVLKEFENFVHFSKAEERLEILEPDQEESLSEICHYQERVAGVVHIRKPSKSENYFMNANN